MNLKTIIRIFEDGNTCVTGLKGRGKDMLFANVTYRRKKPYISNVDYGGYRMPLRLDLIDCGGNTYRNFIDGNVKHYEFPYADGTDVYISDVGVYFPSQYNNQLDKEYANVPIYSALSRQLGCSNIHINVQNLNRAWLKLREMSDSFILCRRCIYFLGFVFQQVTIYDNHDSCQARRKPFRAPFTLSSKMRDTIKLQKLNYDAQYGYIRNGILLYRNKSKYDTRIFKEMLKNGKK